jgi:predicted AlkP superfamily phosphohydrolase/phosphomutase
MSKERVLVIGLDGATLDLINPWMKDGFLPNLNQITRKGNSNKLMSTFPPISPTAWSSFMTGKNPGKHGVFDFTMRDFQTYDMRVASRTSEPTLWGVLSSQGRQVCVVNVPLTYPPEKVNGYMVTGLGTPSQRTFTYPPELTKRLRARGYPLNTSINLEREGANAFIQEVYRESEQVAETAIQLMSQIDWDFSMVVLRLTDEIPHYFWHWMDETHPAYAPSDPLHKEAILRCYQKADKLVDRLITETANEDTTILIMSDHGFGPLYKDVYLNEWLRRQGFLTMRSDPGLQTIFTGLLRHLGLTRTQVGHTLARLGLHRLRGTLRDELGAWGDLFPQDAQCRIAEKVDWTQTQAYSVGYIGQIYLNLVGRDPKGIINPGQEYKRVRNSIIQHLLEMKDPEDGQPVVDQVFKKEDIYHGPHLEKAPDLLVLMRELTYITRQGYQISGRNEIFAKPPTQETGGHRSEGILIAFGNHIKKSAKINNARIIDLAPTILHLLDCEIPNDMDGRVLTEIIHPEFTRMHPFKHHATDTPKEPIATLTPEDEKTIMNHLQNLGYME